MQKRLRVEIVSSLSYINPVRSSIRSWKAFARELAVWADLVHPNLLGLIAYYIDIEEGIMWFISPFAIQGNITKYLEVNDPDMRTRLQLVSRTTLGQVMMTDSA